MAATNRQQKFTEEEDFKQNLGMMVQLRVRAILKE